MKKIAYIILISALFWSCTLWWWPKADKNNQASEENKVSNTNSELTPEEQELIESLLKEVE